MAFQRQHQTHGHVAVVAGDDRGVARQQGGHHAVGEGDLPVVEHHDADVFNGYGGLLLRLVVVRLKFHHQLPIAQRQVGGMRKTEGALDHGCLLFEYYIAQWVNSEMVSFDESLKVGGFQRQV